MMLAEVYEELGNLPQALTLVNYGELLFFAFWYMSYDVLCGVQVS